MRRIGLISIPLLVAVVMAVAGAFLIFDKRFPPVANTRLEEYISHFLPGANVKAIVPAGKPWHFRPQMGEIVVGDGYFRSHYDYEGKANGDGKGLPSAPQEVWCVLLESPRDVMNHTVVESPGNIVVRISLFAQRLTPVADVAPVVIDTKPVVLFVNLYEDLYVARWLIYRPSPALSTQTLQGYVDTVGCRLTIR